MIAHFLLLQLSVCVDEFESLVALVTSMLEGRDPNTSTLLGIKRQYLLFCQYLYVLRSCVVALVQLEQQLYQWTQVMSKDWSKFVSSERTLIDSGHWWLIILLNKWPVTVLYSSIITFATQSELHALY